jgi:saccharopine dehydrogenase (NAD+, L-lysine-forming)
MTSRLPIVVYGATGFTGRLICEELDRKAIPFAVGGRDRQKLEALASRLPSRPAPVVAPLDDPTALERFASMGRVLVSCAGPFARFGKPVQDAALAARTHFLDTTGEHTYVRATHARDTEARDRGIALVNAVGFDIVPTEAAAALAASELPDVDWVRMAVAVKQRPSQGTVRTILSYMGDEGLAFLDGRLVAEDLCADTWKAPFPSPLGHRICHSAPLADVISASQSTRTRNLRTYFSLPPGGRAALKIAAALGRTGPGRALAEHLVSRLPDGPSPADRVRSRFTAVAEAITSSGRRRTVWVTGGDAYDLTAVSAVACASRAADPAFAMRGFLSPSQAFGARELLDALSPIGVRYGID